MHPRPVSRLSRSGRSPLALTAIGLLALAVGLRRAATVRELLRGTSTDVYSLATGTDGPVRVSGTAVPHEKEVVSPYTGTPCLAVEYEERERRWVSFVFGLIFDFFRKRWYVNDFGDGSVPFVLEDDTGSVLVGSTGAKLGLDESEVVEVDRGQRPPRRVQEFTGDEDPVDRRTRYVERRLHGGDRVTVFGEVRDEPGIATEVGQVNAMLAAGAHPLVLSRTSPYRTVLRVFWPALFALCLAALFLGAATLLVL